MAQSQLAAQARRRHTFLLPILSDVLPLESLLVLLFSPLLSISGNSTPYISSSKSGRVSGFLVLSHTFQNVQSCISNHSVPQITVSLVRQTAHNMHTACITSCIHVTKNSNNALTTAGFTPCLAHAIITFSGFVTPCNHGCALSAIQNVENKAMENILYILEIADLHQKHHQAVSV